MELSQLETFLAVAEERSFSRAAQRLHRTQPAVSQTIRKLEEELGEPLFERTSRDGTLTSAGLYVVEVANEQDPSVRGWALPNGKDDAKRTTSHLVCILEGNKGNVR